MGSFKAGALIFLAGAVIGSAQACESRPVPPGARALGYTRIAFDLCPTLSDISLDGIGNATALYNSVWWSPKIPSPSLYADAPDGGVTIAMGGALATVPRTMVPGKLPLLSGSSGFYVEFETRISDNDRDHWPAVWLMPIEHNGRHEDHYPPDVARYERWQEIDVDEGGYAPGPMGTAIAWEGIWPNVKRTRSNPNLKNDPIDRTVRHRFGAGYDPKKLTITFWYDEKQQYTAESPAVSEITRRQNFYLIMNSQSHKTKTPYTMTVYRIRAFVP